MGAVQWTAENTGAAPYGRNQREARPSALPDLHALGADSRPFFWFVLCNCPLAVGMRRKRKVQNTLQRCQLAVVNSWAESQRLRFKDGITSRNNFWTSKSPNNMSLVCQWTEKYEKPLLYPSTSHSTWWKSTSCDIHLAEMSPRWDKRSPNGCLVLVLFQKCRWIWKWVKYGTFRIR